MKKRNSSSYRITTIDPIADERWDQFVENHPFGWICHLSGWKEVLERSFRHLEAHYFVLLRNGKIRAGLPVFEVRSWLTGNRLVSIPFATISDPLISSDNDLALLLNAVMELSRERSLDKIEIRTLNSSPFFSKTDLSIKERYKHHYLPLDRPPEELIKTFHRSCVRQRIARSMKSGLEIVEGNTESDLQDFYRLHVLSRKRIGLPPLPYAFIGSLYSVFYPQGKASLLIAKKDGKSVAAILLLKFKGRVSAEFAVYDAAYLNISPIHLLFWEAIKMTSAEGFSIFDFGRTTLFNKDLMDFKERWGTLVADMPHFHYPANETSSRDDLRENAFSYRLMRKACKKAPAFALPHIGNFCYRHMGYNLSFQINKLNKIDETCPEQGDSCLEVLARTL